MLRNVNSSGKTPPPDNSLSLARVIALRGEAHAEIRNHAAKIVSISSAVSDVDAALQLSISERSIDESQSLVTAARRLSTRLDGSAVAE